MSTVKRYAGLWGPVVLLLLVDFWLSSQSRQNLGFLVAVYGGKPLHFLGYLTLGILLIRALSNGFRDVSFPVALIALSFGVFWAATDEIHQIFVPGRSGNGLGFGDVTIDFGGLVLSVLVSWVYAGNLKFRQSQPRRTSDLAD